MQSQFHIYLICTALWFFSFHSKISAQETSINDSIAISITENKLEFALQKIAAYTGFRFAYRQKLLEHKTISRLQFHGTVDELLHKLLDEHNLCFTAQHAQIIIHTACRPKNYTLSGYVVDSEEQIDIPYVSLSKSNGKVGIIADHEGYFEFNMEYTNSVDTIIVSCMGYQRDTLFVSAENSEGLLVMLTKRIYEMPAIVVKPHQFETLTLGNKKDKSIGSIYLDTHGQQAALFIENKKNVAGTFEAIEYYLSKKGNTNAPFQVRIYTVDSLGLPGEDLIEDVIVVKPEMNKGWYRIDLSRENITFPAAGAFVAIEGVFPDNYDYYLDDTGFINLKESKKQKGNHSLLSYGQRLGYNRKGRKETWHYSVSKVWFQINKQAFGVMISATVKYKKNTDNYDQENEYK